MSQILQFATDAVRLDAGKSRLVLRNPVGVFRADLGTGRFEFAGEGPNSALLLPADAFVATERGRTLASGSAAPLHWRPVAAGPEATVAVEFSRALAAGRSVHWRVAAAATGFTVQVGVIGGVDPVTGLGLAFPRVGSSLAAGRCPQALRIAYCGAHSRSPLSRSEIVPLRATTSVCSWWATAWFDAASEAGFVLGYLKAHRFAGRFEIDGFAGKAINLVERIRPGRRTPLWSEPLWISPAGNVCDALQDYGRQVGRGCPHPRGAAVAPWGWGSWTHFADAVDAPCVLANARVARDLGVSSGAGPLLHVDHGWEEQFRTHRPTPAWKPRREFAGSVPVLAQNLRYKGCQLGLWVVPFAINTTGPVSRARGAAVLKDSAGKPSPVIGTDCYCVDPTSPAGEAWLRSLFAKLVGWGASHLKLDFLRVLVAHEPDDPVDGLTQPRRFHRAMTRIEAYRHGLGIIRDVVGPRVHLLAGGAPLLPSAGLVESCRIGGDIEVAWEHGQAGIRRCAENARCNFFWHGQVWRNDPDFLVIPAEDRLFRHWAAAVAFAGGAALVSADLPGLSPRQRAELCRYLPALPGSPRPLGLAPRDGGTRIGQTMSVHGETVWLLALFNNSEKPHTRCVSLDDLAPASTGAGVAWDVVAGRLIGRSGRNWRVVVPARDARVVGVRMAQARPQIIGTSGHIGMDQLELAEVTWNSKTRELRCARHAAHPWPERIYFRVPGRFRVVPIPGVTFDRRSRIGVAKLRGTRSRAVAFSFLSKP